MNNKTAFFLSFLLIVFSASNSWSQDDDNVLIYSSYDDTETTKASKTVSLLVKINPLLILNGDLPIYVEKPIGENFSLELGLGVTHDDLFYEAFQVDNFETSEARRATLGYSGRLAAKFYPSSYYPAPEGWYGGIEFRYRRYNTEVLDDCDNSSFSSTYLDEYRKQADGRIIFGYNLILGENIVFDIYSGIGMRWTDLNHYACVSSGPSTFLFSDPDNGQTTAPRLSLGFKFGFAI